MKRDVKFFSCRKMKDKQEVVIEFKDCETERNFSLIMPSNNAYELYSNLHKKFNVRELKRGLENEMS